MNVESLPYTITRCCIQSIMAKFIKNLKTVAHIQRKKVIIGDRSPKNPDIKIII